MKILLVSIILLFPSSTLAQDLTVREKLPTVESNAAGEKCLNAEQWQQVLVVSNQNKGLFEWRLKIESTLADYKATTALYENTISKLELQLKIYERDREYLTTRLTQTEKELDTRLKIPKIEKGIMWGIIAVETIIIGIFGVRGVAK